MREDEVRATLGRYALKYAWKLNLDGQCEVAWSILNKINALFEVDIDFEMTATEACELLTKCKEKNK